MKWFICSLFLGRHYQLWEKKFWDLCNKRPPRGRLLDRGRLTQNSIQWGRLLDTGRLLEDGPLLDHLRYLRIKVVT